MQEMLIRLGIPTLFVSLPIDLPVAPKLNNPIKSILQSQIGRIYGMSIYTDTVSPTNEPLITTVDAQNLYLNLKWGAYNFTENIRLDDMLFSLTVVPVITDRRYLPVNIPKGFNLDESSIINPALIPGAKTILLNFWYITKTTYAGLLKSGLVMSNGMPATQEEINFTLAEGNK